MTPYWLLFVALFGVQGDASASSLPELSALLKECQAVGPKFPGTRGASDKLDVAKRRLRDWVESKLAGLDFRADEGLLARQLNAELRAAGLICPANGCATARDESRSNLGHVDDVKLYRRGVFLIVQTAVGIECGFDESAYLYSWSSEGWRRVWQNEQSVSAKPAYTPQTIRDVLVSPYSKTNNYVLLTLGSASWCTSNWHSVYYRVFRLGPDAEAKPLLDRAEQAYLVGDPPIHGFIKWNEALVEFRIGSLDIVVHNRPAIRHYEFVGDEIRRIAPLALSPRDFVEEWLTHTWIEASAWSEEAHRGILRDAHEKLKGGRGASEFLYPATRCKGRPDVWQVGFDFSDPPRQWDAKIQGTYFFVRWRPPYNFKMVNVAGRPDPLCSVADDEATADRTLFPNRDNR